MDSHPTIADIIRWLKTQTSDGTVEVRKSRRGLWLGLHGTPPVADSFYQCNSYGECGWLRKEPSLDFDQTYKVGDATKVEIAAGHVRLIGANISSGGVPTCIETAVAGLTGASALDISGADQCAWVEITAAPGSNPSVNATVQTGALASWAKYATTSSGTLTVRHRLGYSTSGVWYREWTGEVEVPSTLYQPNISGSTSTFQYKSANGFRTFAINTDKTASVDGGTNQNFLEAKHLGVLVLGGQVAQLEEIADLKFGGTSDDVGIDRPAMPTFPADNQFKFAAYTRTLNVTKGLVQTNTDAAKSSADVVLTTDGLWVKLDSALKQVQHAHLGSNSNYDWTTVYVAASSGGAVTVPAIVDVEGHIRYINGAGPTPTLKYKCQKCSDPSTIIYRTSDPGAFFSIAGVCYERVGQVLSAATVNSDSITATYASCAACAAAVVNYKWLKCSDNSAAAVFAPGTQPTNTYALIKLSGTWTKCYYSAITDEAATSPVPVHYEWDTPTVCDDLNMPVSDSFSGTGPDSATTSAANSDDAWNVRWATILAAGTASQTVSGGNLALSVTDTGTGTVYIGALCRSFADNTGNFEAIWRLTGMSFGGLAAPTPAVFMVYCYVYDNGSPVGWIGYGFNNSDLAGYGCRSSLDAGSSFGSDTSMGNISSIYLRIYRASGTLYAQWSTDGTNWTTVRSRATSMAIDGVRHSLVKDNTAVTGSANLEYVTVKDAAGGNNIVYTSYP